MDGIFLSKKTPEEKPEPGQAPEKRRVCFTSAYSPYEDSFEVEKLSFFEKQYVLETMSRSIDWKTSGQYTEVLTVTAEVFKAFTHKEFGKTLCVLPLSALTRNTTYVRKRALISEGTSRDILFTITGVASWSEVPHIASLQVEVGLQFLPPVPLTKLHEYEETIITTPLPKIVRKFPRVQDTPPITVMPQHHYRIELVSSGEYQVDLALLGWVFVPSEYVNELIEGGLHGHYPSEETTD